MIDYKKYQLDNGLCLLVHQDKNTPLVAVNILYKVGARNENPERTGFAHLFEHLMFGGSANIPNFDRPLEMAGGENNAFTNNDITNYYCTLPAENIETALWLESDRMLQLAFTPKSLEVQRNVVIEEYKQRYLNQPYGDAMLLLRPLAYKVHPYRWATIGKEISHIENATLQEVKDFFFKHYRPNNAVMVISGNIKPEKAFELTKKWFEDIPKGDFAKGNISQEPEQLEERRLTVKRKVPQSAIYMAFKMCKKTDKDFYATDLVSDILAMEDSGRFYKKLVKEKAIFSHISAYVSGDLDNGLFIISGKVYDKYTLDEAEKAVWQVLEELKNNLVPEKELEKVKNKLISSKLFSDTNILGKAMQLAFAELLGDASLANEEVEKYKVVKATEIQSVANGIFNKKNVSVLHYLSEKDDK